MNFPLPVVRVCPITVMADVVLKIGVLIQLGKHSIMDDAESGAEEFYQPGNIDLPGACSEMAVVAERLSGGVELVQLPGE